MGVQKRKTTHGEDELRRKLAAADERIAELERMLGFKDAVDAELSLDEMVLAHEIKRLERSLAELETENLLLADQLRASSQAAGKRCETFSAN